MVEGIRFIFYCLDRLLLSHPTTTNLKEVSMKFPKTYRLCTIFILFTVILSFNVYASSYPWRDHRRPFDFEFSNHFDTHQQSQEIDTALDVCWDDVDHDGDMDVPFCGSSTPMRVYINGEVA